MAPELNRRRAVFVLGKIDEILGWEKTKEQEKGRAGRRARGILVRGQVEAVLEARETEVIRRISRKALSRIAPKSLLPDGLSRDSRQEYPGDSGDE